MAVIGQQLMARCCNVNNDEKFSRPIITAITIRGSTDGFIQEKCKFYLKNSFEIINLATAKNGNCITNNAYFAEFIMQMPAKCRLRNFYHLMLLKISKVIKLLL